MARNNSKNNGGHNGGNQNQGAGAKIMCNICGKPGHMGKDCLSNKKCTNCGMTGHLAAKCHSKTGKNQGNQQNNNSGKFCNFCNFRGHTDADCRKNPANQNNGTPIQIGRRGQQKLPIQIPLYNGQTVPFSDPCQLCGQNTHYAKECPQRGIVPTTGQYFPQTYPQHSWAASSGPQVSNSMPWMSLTQHPGYTEGPGLIGEEVSTRPAYPAPVQYAQVPSGAVYKEHYGYATPEIACERPKLIDRDGDYIMGNSWECGECVIPTRQTDFSSCRWPVLPTPQAPSYQVHYAQAPLHQSQYPQAQYQTRYRI